MRSRGGLRASFHRGDAETQRKARRAQLEIREHVSFPGSSAEEAEFWGFLGTLTYAVALSGAAVARALLPARLGLVPPETNHVILFQSGTAC
jgi:hypothetical protein